MSYTVIWTHEDVGDGIVAAYEWGLWGRMTDIETVLNEKVDPNGKILSASYLSCGCEGAPVYPDIVPENPANGGETDKPYPQTGASPGLGNHLRIRDATGNNDISPTGHHFVPVAADPRHGSRGRPDPGGGDGHQQLDVPDLRR